MWDMNNMVASYVTPVSVNESLVMLEQRAKWIRSVNMGQEEMIREVTVVHKGREGSPSWTRPASVSLEQLWRLREERLGRYWARYLREMSDMSVLDKSKCRKEERGDLLLSLGLNKEEMEESFMLVTEPRFKQVIAGQFELVRAATEATQSRPCRDNTLMLDSLGSTQAAACWCS